MLLQENILCAAAPVSPAAGAGLIAIHDIQTGATLASFKQTNAGPHSVAVLETRNSQGGFVLASQADKSLLNLYNFQKDQISLKIVLPEKLTCITIDRSGNLCAGGTASGRIFLWETSSGVMYNCWDAHYRRINILRFTNDGCALISGSDDSSVNVWSVSRLLDNELQNEHVLPFCSFSDHTLPITDILCSIGLFPECRILTASVDHTVKLWDLSSRSLLTTFQFPQPISFLAWDVTERLFFAASSNGSVHQTNLFHQRDSPLGPVTEAVGGAGVTDTVRIHHDQSREERRKRLITVGQPVTSICISLNSTILLVGTSEGLIHLYDIPSHQLLRSISTHKGMSISHIQTIIKPPDLVGHVTLQMQAGVDTKDVIPVKPVVPFQRFQDAKAREAHEVTLLLPHVKENYNDEASDYTSEEFLRDYNYFMQPVTNGQNYESDPISLRSKVSELEMEVQSLRDQLNRAKDVNDAMWDTVVQQFVSQGQAKPSESDVAGGKDSGGDQGRRKRGRI